MMGVFTDRTGEETYNKFGSKMIITEYRGALDIDVYFPEYNWTFEHTQYGVFKKGQVKCPYDKSVYGVGYLGEGEYKASINNKNTKCYNTWRGMLQRCYDPKYQEKKPTYKGCRVEDYLLCFQNFAEFYYNIYYEVPGEIMHLDKDILYKGNKIYSRSTCCFVPDRINSLFTKCDSHRGDLPIGVSEDHNKYRARCHNTESIIINLGTYVTPIKAFEVYKNFKEITIKKVADKYKDMIPNNVYEALYNYQVEITD